MLALHLVEQGRGHAVIILVQLGLGRQIQRFHVMGDIGRILGLAAAARTTRQQHKTSRGGGKNRKAERRCAMRENSHGAAITSPRLNAK